MRRVAVFLCIVAILFSFLGCQNIYTHAIYEITITDSQLLNNCVGNDWTKVYIHDGKTITSGEQWTVALGTVETVAIDVTVTENEKYNDVGYGSLSVTLKDGFETYTIITVTENNGRYKGNIAQWEISCKVKLIENFKQI